MYLAHPCVFSPLAFYFLFFLFPPFFRSFESGNVYVCRRIGSSFVWFGRGIGLVVLGGAGPDVAMIRRVFGDCGSGNFPDAVGCPCCSRAAAESVYPLCGLAATTLSCGDGPFWGGYKGGKSERQKKGGGPSLAGNQAWAVCQVGVRVERTE